MSPAFTGLFNGDYRLSAIYRSQWQSVPVSYSTFNMNGEARLKPRFLKKDLIGVGVIFNSDKAGDANYGTTQFYLSASYIFIASRDSSLMFSLGGSGGWCQVGFDFSKMTFDSQFDGMRFNSGLSSSEQFSWTQRTFMDFNAGGAVSYIAKGRHRFNYALGVYHVSSPTISYQGNDLNKLDYKMSHYFSYTTPINERSDIVGEMLYALQGENYEAIPHVSVKRYMNRAENQAILFGACWRARDAVVLRAGYHQGTLQSGISYDINISKFSAASNRRGAFEIFVNYVFRIKPGFIAKKRLCPLFI